MNHKGRSSTWSSALCRPRWAPGEDIDATSLSFVSPGAAAEIARALERIEPGEMVRLIGERAAGPPLDDGDREDLADCYEQLRQAYRAAAAVGAG